MGSEERQFFETLKKQILGGLALAAVTGLTSTFVFMLTINGRMDSVEKQLDRHETQIQTIIFQK